MEKQEIIEKIKNEMLDANNCPMYHKNDYDLEKCNCYKSEIIKFIQSIHVIDNDTVQEIVRIFTNFMLRDSIEKFINHINNVQPQDLNFIINNAIPNGGIISDKFLPQNKSILNSHTETCIPSKVYEKLKEANDDKKNNE